MATPDVPNNLSANDSMTANDLATASEEQLTAVDADSRFADYRPSWWVSPLIGVAMLLAMLVIHLGLRFERDVIAYCGIVLFGLAFCALAVAAVRYTWLLARDISDWRRSAKRVPKA